MSTGWIKLHRQLRENPLYYSERFTHMQAWIDLLLNTNHSKGLFYVRGNEVKVNPGQSARSIKTLSTQWKWNERTVKKFLEYLQKEQMIHYRTNHITTIITIIKWEFYQSNTSQTTSQTTSQMQNRIHTNKNVKNVNNEKTVEAATAFPHLQDPDFSKSFDDYKSMKLSKRKNSYSNKKQRTDLEQLSKYPITEAIQYLENAVNKNRTFLIIPNK